jgi:hypothetical protein
LPSLSTATQKLDDVHDTEASCCDASISDGELQLVPL